MKTINRILITTATLLAVACGGARDDKNEVENYPTYDTTRKPNTVNDSTSGTQHEGGNPRHNIDDHKNGEK